jgi:hypothetical protein
MADKSIYSIVISAVILIRSDDIYAPRLMNCWLPAETWVEALQKLGHIDASLTFTVRQFNAAFSRSSSFGSVISRFDGSNESGIFRATFQHRHYYYLTQEKKQVIYPSPLDRVWKEKVLEFAANVLVIPSTRARPAAIAICVADTTAEKTNDGFAEQSIEDQGPSPSKRQRTDAPLDSRSNTTTYWASPEAHSLFCPRRRSGGSVSGVSVCNESPHETLERRIRVLQSVHKGEDCWRNVILGRDADNFCTKAEIFEIRQRATFLCRAYQLAILRMNQWTWYKCCQEACNELNALGMLQARSYKTVAAWNMTYRQVEGFPHPNPYIQCGKRPLPRLLEVFPDAKDQIVSFALKNLAKLTIEGVHDFILSKVIPRLITLWKSDVAASVSSSSTTTTTTNDSPNEELLDHDDQIRSFLNAHRLESFSLTTAWRWMRLLGFHYDLRKKSFYVDGHEREDVVANRKTFCKEYLTEYEPYCRRWVQISKEDAAAIKDLDTGFGYHYYNIIAGKDYIEFHVDYWNRFRCFKEERAPTVPIIEPTMSIRVSSKAKPIMLIGQDESVFAQYLLGSKTWIGPKGQRPLLPKSEGDGYMLSAFVSRELGFGRRLTADELTTINNERRIGKTYKDTQAAEEILKTHHKPLLTESPFVKYLYIGANNEGFWNSYHMALQFEDVVDCLIVLYPEFEFIFLFDHSQGHARKRNGALNALHMSKNYGGAQPVMRDTTILSDIGYLGPNSPLLKVGDTQSLIFKTEDSGPWYLSPEEKERQRHNRPTGKRKRIERSKKMLVDALAAAGVVLQQQRNHTKKELIEFANNNGVDLYEDRELVIPGWQGQPKGLMQVLWERGFIDVSALERYTLDGRKNPITGEVNLQSSLRHILANCKDFKDEETALQFLGTQLGVTVKLTPKFHAELAGEGIEYSWAHSKAFYRRLPLSQKRGRENFKKLVRDCTCPESVLTKVRMEKFAARARAYICTYHHLEQQKELAAAHQNSDNHDETERTNQQELLYSEIERLMKDMRGHRCALHFDWRFVNSVLKEATAKNEEVE